MQSIILLFFIFIVIAISFSKFKNPSGRPNTQRTVNDDINQQLLMHQMMNDQARHNPNDLDNDGIPDNVEYQMMDSNDAGTGESAFDSGSSSDSSSSFDSGSSGSDN